jgi:hypothetical protein
MSSACKVTLLYYIHFNTKKEKPCLSLMRRCSARADLDTPLIGLRYSLSPSLGLRLLGILEILGAIEVQEPCYGASPAAAGALQIAQESCTATVARWRTTRPKK